MKRNELLNVVAEDIFAKRKLTTAF